jgi:hypothetical protein
LLLPLALNLRCGLVSVYGVFTPASAPQSTHPQGEPTPVGQQVC